jgi:hypothetical protein
MINKIKKLICKIFGHDIYAHCLATPQNDYIFSVCCRCKQFQYQKTKQSEGKIKGMSFSGIFVDELKSLKESEE